MTLSPLARAALAYAEHQLPVFPVEPRGKRPLVAHGFHESTTDRAQLVAWWEAHPAANIGAVPARLGAIAFDIDSPPARAVAEALELLHVRTYCTATPNGEHRFFRAELPTGHSIRFGLGEAGGDPASPRALLSRYDAGYVLLPPSVHPSGLRYRANGHFAEMALLPATARDAYLRRAAKLAAAAAAPASVAERGVTDDWQRERRMAAYLARVGHAHEGARNDTAYRVAAALLRDFACPTDEAWARLGNWNAACCLPPLSARELRACFVSARRHARRAIGAAYADDRPRTERLPGAFASLQAREANLLQLARREARR